LTTPIPGARASPGGAGGYFAFEATYEATYFGSGAAVFKFAAYCGAYFVGSFFLFFAADLLASITFVEADKVKC
jgi:hypothetical protein